MAASHVHWKQEDARNVHRDINRLCNVGFEVASAYEGVSDQERINMIGSSIQDFGQKWIDKHPKQIEWLESIGMTPAEAEQSFKDWFGNVRSKLHQTE